MRLMPYPLATALLKAVLVASRYLATPNKGIVTPYDWLRTWRVSSHTASHPVSYTR
jgi:hypothetical protein